jgi:hypothetical protein
MARSHTGGPLEQAASEAVRHYLDGLRAGRRPGTAATRRATERRLATIDLELVTATPMHELRLVQERRDLLERARWHEQEDAFVAVARTYSERHGISYETWRAVGVTPSVLRRAGMDPTHRPPLSTS